MNSTSRSAFAGVSAVMIALCGVVWRTAPASGLTAEGYGGMAIQAAGAEGVALRVVTTGVEYVFDRARSQIECFQRIATRRRVAVIKGLSLRDVKLNRPTAAQCEISSSDGSQRFTIGSDSLLRIRCATPAAIVVEGGYQPKYRQNVGSDFFLPDEQGGVGVYLVSGKANVERPATWKADWSLRYSLSAPAELWVSVFPPKPFPWQQSYETMLHSFSSKHPYPSDAELQAWRKYGSILTLHSWVWKGPTGISRYGVEDDDSFRARQFQPKSEAELRRVVKTAHQLRMKVIVYMSPYYAADPTPQGIEDFAARVAGSMRQYGLDGVYFDGAAARVEAAYGFVARMRQVIGPDGVLHLHLTGVPSMVCPFIDCHADYILRGEHMGLNEAYVRWFVSSYNLGNSIGTFCYDTLRVDKAMIDRLLAVHARLPFWPGDGTWHGVKYHLTEAEQQLMAREYYPRLEKERH